MTTIINALIIVALVIAGLYVWGENIKLRREKAKTAEQVFAEGKKLLSEYDSTIAKLDVDHRKEIAELRAALYRAQGETTETKAKLAETKANLAKFDRIRGEGGKFVRPDGTYTPYDEPETDIDEMTDVELAAATEIEVGHE